MLSVDSVMYTDSLRTRLGDPQVGPILAVKCRLCLWISQLPNTVVDWSPSTRIVLGNLYRRPRIESDLSAQRSDVHDSALLHHARCMHVHDHESCTFVHSAMGIYRTYLSFT